VKVLILAYDFPPYTSMGGQRPYGWASYLGESEISATVVTRHWPDTIRRKEDYNRSCNYAVSREVLGAGTVIRVPFRGNLSDRILIRFGFGRFDFLRQILTLFYAVFQFLSFFFDNKSPIYKEARKELKSGGYSAIIATGEPFILFKYAYKLSQEFGIPWVADYRDCWSDNYEINQNGGFRKLLYSKFFRFFERKYVETSMQITTAAPVFQTELSRLFPNHTIEVIYNGFVRVDDPGENQCPEKRSNLTVGFAGTIYGFQPVEMFLAGLKLFVEKRPDAKIEAIFWGTDYIESQKKRITNFDRSILSYIKTTERLDKQVLFREMSSVHLLLLLDNKGMISGKLYEYLLFGKKVLMAGRDHGAMEQILNATNSGIICDTPQEIAQALEKCYTEWQETGTVICNSKNIEQYSRREQTRKLAELILGI